MNRHTTQQVGARGRAASRGRFPASPHTPRTRLFRPDTRLL